jgi:hypothetical protein
MQSTTGGTFAFEGKLPNGNYVKMTCAPMINYNAGSAHITGVDIPISKAAGIDVKVGAVDLDPQTLRQASDLIEALDTAQFNYCRTLPFASSQDILKLWTDTNTQQQTLSTLLRNLTTAQTPSEAKAAIATAASAASTATTPPPGAAGASVAEATNGVTAAVPQPSPGSPNALPAASEAPPMGAGSSPVTPITLASPATSMPKDAVLATAAQAALQLQSAAKTITGH